jgi:hypothetical protein
MEQRKRRKLLQQSIASAVGPLRFNHHSGEYFVRDRGELTDVFFFQQTRNNNQFYISYGIDCPKLLSSTRGNITLAIPDMPKLLISNGRLENNHSYGCKHEDHIENSAAKVASALSQEANPWLNQFETAEDLIENYRSTQIGLNSPSSNVPQNEELRWLIYGLMLHDINDNKSFSWLQPVLTSYKLRPKMTAQDNEWIRIIESKSP